MATIAERLAKGRKMAGYGSARAAAQAMGANYNSYAQHENSTQGRGVPREAAIRYAKFFRISLDWLLTGKGDPKGRQTTVPVTSLVGAGAAVIPFPDQGTLEDEPVLADLAGCEAAIIRGDSMPPFQPGWLIIWRQENEGVQDACIGKLCVVDVKEGPTLVKVVRKGTKKGLWTLESWKGNNLADQILNWASPVLYIQPK